MVCPGTREKLSNGFPAPPLENDIFSEPKKRAKKCQRNKKKKTKKKHYGSEEYRRECSVTAQPNARKLGCDWGSILKKLPWP